MVEDDAYRHSLIAPVRGLGWSWLEGHSLADSVSQRLTSFFWSVPVWVSCNDACMESYARATYVHLDVHLDVQIDIHLDVQLDVQLDVHASIPGELESPMSEPSDVSHQVPFTAQALWGAHIASVVDPASSIPQWLEGAGAEHVELWTERGSLSETIAREVTQRAHAIVIDLDADPARAFGLATMVSPSCGVLFTAKSIDAPTCRKIEHAHWGYRSKHTSQGDFLLALRRLARLNVPDPARLVAHAARLWSLSPQQARVLYYNLWSYCDQDIADALDVSIHTVQEYQEGLRKKSGARSKQAYLARLIEVSGTRSAPASRAGVGSRRSTASARVGLRAPRVADDPSPMHMEGRSLFG